MFLLLFSLRLRRLNRGLQMLDSQRHDISAGKYLFVSHMSVSQGVFSLKTEPYLSLIRVDSHLLNVNPKAKAKHWWFGRCSMWICTWIFWESVEIFHTQWMWVQNTLFLKLQPFFVNSNLLTISLLPELWFVFARCKLTLTATKLLLSVKQMRLYSKMMSSLVTGKLLLAVPFQTQKNWGLRQIRPLQVLAVTAVPQ